MSSSLKKALIILIITFTLLLIGAALDPTNAQTSNCAERNVVVARLASIYGETRQSIGIGGGNVVVETFASDKTGTWTITVTTSGGLTCLVASGQAYEELNEELLDEGDAL